MEVESADQGSFSSEVMETALIEQCDVVMTRAIIEQEPSVTPGQSRHVHQRVLDPEVGNVLAQQPTMSTGRKQSRTSLSDKAKVDTIYCSLDLLEAV